jgi:hypothetical protein
MNGLTHRVTREQNLLTAAQCCAAHSFPLGESPLWSAFLPLRILLFPLLAYNEFIHPEPGQPCIHCDNVIVW